MPVAFRYRLAAALADGAVGHAAPGARILVAQNQGGAQWTGKLVIASAAGAFAVTLHDPFAGDASS